MKHKLSRSTLGRKGSTAMSMNSAVLMKMRDDWHMLFLLFFMHSYARGEAWLHVHDLPPVLQFGTVSTAPNSPRRRRFHKQL